MNGQEKVIKHLEMTQGAINRLGGNSFLLKSWSMTALVAAMVLMARQDAPNPYLALTLIVPIVGFGSWMDTFSGRKDCFARFTTRSGNRTTRTLKWVF